MPGGAEDEAGGPGARVAVNVHNTDGLCMAAPGARVVVLAAAVALGAAARGALLLAKLWLPGTATD